MRRSWIFSVATSALVYAYRSTRSRASSPWFSLWRFKSPYTMSGTSGPL